MLGGTATGCLTSPMEKTVERVRVCVHQQTSYVVSQRGGTGLSHHVYKDAVSDHAGAGKSSAPCGVIRMAVCSGCIPAYRE